MKKAFMYVMVLCVSMFVLGCGEPAKKPTPKTGGAAAPADTKTVDTKDKSK